MGGSFQYSGAPALAALAALRAGADGVTIAAPRRAADIAAGFSPCLVTYPLSGKVVSRRHMEDIARRFFPHADAAVIGCGMGIRGERHSFSFLRTFLRTSPVPLVIDGDGLRACSGAWKAGSASVVLTPHQGEFERMAGPLPKEKRARMRAVASFARKHAVVVLLKGSEDVISDGKKTCVNRTGTPFLTVGGTGDMLAGITGAFLAMGADPFMAACGSAYVMGKAGERAARGARRSISVEEILDTLARV